ncbi:thioredoxin fold domain-containing protein [Roseivirga thermotolerans]|uniref:thioredoxin fold domain-containing protein n=1 Tax=Roseivirga thermotolerans TaxID=1758176 RepID=UPI00273DE0DC|nr:thioredoxin fold domain-containing protein [Roseivirga thermotolerans]
MKVHLTLLGIFLFGWAGAHELESIDFREVKSLAEWDAIFEEAKTNNKLVFADAYTDWCGYCKKLDKEVFTNPEVISYFEQHFINIKFNAETEFGYPLADKYGIDGYPTMLFLTGERNVFYRIGGFVEAPVLMAHGKEAIENWTLLPDLLLKYDAGIIEKEEQRQLIGILSATDPLKAQEVAKELADSFTDEDYMELENLWLLANFENTINSRHFNYIANNKAKIIEAHGISEFTDYMSAIYNQNLQLAIKYGDRELLEKIVSVVIPLFIDQAELPAAQFVTRSVFFAEREEYDSYKLEVNSYMNNHLATDQQPDFVISTVVEIIESFGSQDLYAFSKQLLSESLKIEANRFETHALLGYINGLLGNFDSANQWLEKAKSLAKTDEQEGFVENLKEAVRMMQ